MPASRIIVAGAAAAGLVAGGIAAPAPAASAGHVIEAGGPDYAYDSAYAQARTKIKVRSVGGATMVSLDVAGFPESAAGQEFGVHVHKSRCGPDPADAGPHYQNPDAAPGTPLYAKEVWLDVTIGPGGRGHSSTAVPWTIGQGDAGSVVVHAHPTDHATGDAGARLLCTTVPFGD